MILILMVTCCVTVLMLSGCLPAHMFSPVVLDDASCHLTGEVFEQS